MTRHSWVFQQYSLYPHLSVFENMAFALRAPIRRVPEPRSAPVRSRPSSTSKAIIRQRMSADRCAGRDRPGSRSPAIYLMDEILLADAKLRGEMRPNSRIQTDFGAMISTSPMIRPAMTMASRIGVVEAGQLINRNAARDLREPDQRFARGLVSRRQLVARWAGRAARGSDDRRANRASDDCARQRRRVGDRCDRASRRPEPSPPDLGGQPVVDLSDPEAAWGRGYRVASPQQAAVLMRPAEDRA